MTEKNDNNHETERQAHHLRLPGFIIDDDVGLGDAVKRITHAVGVRPCGGCAQRAATLNHWLVFSGRHRKKIRSKKSTLSGREPWMRMKLDASINELCRMTDWLCSVPVRDFV
jgi:hypothetical protein